MYQQRSLDPGSTNRVASEGMASAAVLAPASVATA